VKQVVLDWFSGKFNCALGSFSLPISGAAINLSRLGELPRQKRQGENAMNKFVAGLAVTAIAFSATASSATHIL
jgi:hypothetical protein